jgi:hypothetical protein
MVPAPVVVSAAFLAPRAAEHPPTHVLASSPSAAIPVPRVIVVRDFFVRQP